ncbi:hypothetical protein BDR06DRAFT_1003488 [Suillus hirtellus]|nr:hypothetical protein BDR06DRAFT_1003488 [Suillus hirtellus]
MSVSDITIPSGAIGTPGNHIPSHQTLRKSVTADFCGVPIVPEGILLLLCSYLHHLWLCPTAPAIFNVVENFSTYELKAYCLWHLGCLYITLSQLTDAMKIFKAAGVLYLATGNHEIVAACVIKCADLCRCQGRFIQYQQLLDGFQRSELWQYLSEPMKDQVSYFLDDARMCTFTAPADELFVKSSDSDHLYGLRSKIQHWRAKLYHGGNIVQVHEHLENLLP